MRKIRTHRLDAGGHSAQDDMYCAMEWISHEIFGYQGKEDAPHEVDSRIAHAVRALNDLLGDADRQRLVPHLERIATCAPVWDDEARWRLETKQRSFLITIRNLQYDKAWCVLRPESVDAAFTQFEELLAYYDEVTGTKWQDRPLPEIPPVMEQLETTPPIQTLDLSKPYMPDYKPSVKVKAQVLVEEKLNKFKLALK